MGGTRAPFIYEAVQKDDRFPASSFDPKSVTRSSYETKPPKRKQNGPLVSINRHPDAHVVLTGRSNFTAMGLKTKAWIKGMRVVQLALRVFELIGAVGLLVLMILINNVDPLTGWVLRITLGVAVVHCFYGVYHLSKAARGRTPGSSAAYHVFAGVSDMCIMPLYAYGVISARNQAGSPDEWGTLLANKSLVSYLVPAVYYGLISTGGLHLISLAISLWLGVMFRRITMMPPDMNPLESNLTTRAHKRNKSSVATSIYADSEKRLDTPSERHPATMSSGELSRPPGIPFMHTRHGSQASINTRDSRLDLPSRQYQLTPSNSPRNSTISLDMKRMSAPPRSSPRVDSAYTEIPLSETNTGRSRPNSSYSPYRANAASPAPAQTASPRAPKFTEAWYASESLVQRTQQRSRAMNVNNTASKHRTYEALDQGYDVSPDSESDNENAENDYANPNAQVANKDGTMHPNPLRSHPTISATPSPPAHAPAHAPAPAPALTPTQRRPKTPFSRVRNSVLSVINLNDRRVSGGNSQDITEEKWEGRNRDSSIQPDSDFYSKPYGDLKPGTPPIIIGGAERQVSSGNDYDLGSGGVFGRRHVSGKIAEEGLGGRFSRYDE